MAVATMDTRPDGIGPGGPILSARGLAVHFGVVRALDGVDLDVFPGEIVALAGENGAGKSTLVRCLAGDVRPDTGTVTVGRARVDSDAVAARRRGLAVVWQDLALCDNLDIAANLLLGGESRRSLFASGRFYRQARQLLEQLGINLPSLGTPVGHLSGGQRQLVAVARAMRDHPDVLILDEPTAALGVHESAQVEELAAKLPVQGTAVLLVSHDVEQMFRLADRIVIMRKGRVVGQVRPEESHPDEVAGLLSGQPPDGSARSQLSRLDSLAGQLASAEPSSSLSLILSALRAALGEAAVCVHERDGSVLRLAGAAGLTSELARAWGALPLGAGGGQIGRAFSAGREIVVEDVRAAPGWARFGRQARNGGVRSAWTVPLSGAGTAGVMTVLSRETGAPTRDQLSLANVYSGYVAGALERDRLLGELTTRNRVLETIREVLETLAGPVPIEAGLSVALDALRRGLNAEEVALLTSPPPGTGDEAGPGPGGATDGTPEQPLRVLAWSGTGFPSPDLARVVRAVRGAGGRATLEPSRDPGGSAWRVGVEFPAPDGPAVLLVTWTDDAESPSHRLLIEDAANSLRLALEREASERAQREAVALRTSQERQRQFLSFLSHELRTPLTAIRGYASSLMQPDVDWDDGSRQRFLSTIADESSRLGRLVDDLLDFSAIDTGILRLHPDWCDLALVLEAARACLPASAAGLVDLRTPADLPTVWADHDRLEQLLVNLLDNAIRHNPPGTTVVAAVDCDPDGYVRISVTDDGTGLPAEMIGSPFGRRAERRSRTGGAGLGLSIAQGIVSAHGGSFDIERPEVGTRCVITLPVAKGAPADG
ncbi:MAG TPA: ATP-binding cassette domain-containing protein [Acidimicrobiales bacterium]|nr:ATP-binding cassette domain-containing protein [Acidimicrobiales bacterium]